MRSEANAKHDDGKDDDADQNQRAGHMSLSDRIISVESGGDANARNPNSTAGGAGQFIDATWLEMLAKHRPDLTGSRDELLALKSDKALSKEMTDAYAAQNAGILNGAGLPVTPGTTYLAHFAGPKGAVGLLNADPNTPAGAIMGAAAVKANPFLANMTAGDVAAWADRKMGGAAAPMAMGGPRPAAPPIASAPPATTSAPAVDQPARAPAWQIKGSGDAPAANLAALAATPVLQNLLPQRPNLFGLKTAPFSLRG